jgi:hypothetical protein
VIRHEESSIDLGSGNVWHDVRPLSLIMIVHPATPGH